LHARPPSHKTPHNHHRPINCWPLAGPLPAHAGGEDGLDRGGSLDVEGAEDILNDSLYEEGASAKLDNANLRVEPLELSWQRIGCSYRTATGTKVVLQDVYGRASPGEMQVRVRLLLALLKTVTACLLWWVWAQLHR
jgi:hypothetical protein